MPIAVWRGVRVVSVASYLFLVVALLDWPTTGLTVFFGLVVPLLPVLFFVAPGNVAQHLSAGRDEPDAESPRLQPGLTPPGWLRSAAI